MKQGTNSRRPRARSNNGKRPSNRNSNYDSGGSDGRIRGNASQVHEKYLTLAREALSFDDSISPYFIANLLWYPAFENLFSIVRRIISKKKIEAADQFHLHQMIYNFFIKKDLVKSIYLNTLVANLINIYNLFT